MRITLLTSADNRTDSHNFCAWWIDPGGRFGGSPPRTLTATDFTLKGPGAKVQFLIVPERPVSTSKSLRFGSLPSGESTGCRELIRGSCSVPGTAPVAKASVPNSFIETIRFTCSAFMIGWCLVYSGVYGHHHGLIVEYFQYFKTSVTLHFFLPLPGPWQPAVCFFSL